MKVETETCILINGGFASLKHLFSINSYYSILKYYQNLSEGFKTILHSTKVFGLTFPALNIGKKL